jgi:cell fate regulator YaaT (PSP1 superfamily)
MMTIKDAMPRVVGIRFKDSGKIYFFDPNGLDLLARGDHVVVETVRGLELAKVADVPHDVDQSEVVGELKPVVRRAEQADFERLQALNESHAEVLQRCAEKIEEHHLPMRLVKAEYSFDGSRLTFYFTAEKRVDFRALVRDLARTFRARIELRQIGPRDEAKLLGGIGPCGRLLCCATFLPDYAHVSIKMAKDQDLPLNPTKISGVCGRLLCCLSYEHEQYLDIKQELPRRGMWVQTPDGPGEVVAVNVVRETVTVELAGSGVQEEFKPSQLQEASRKVGDEARRRNEEGITPAAQMERSGPRPPRNRGERRFLRDQIDSPDILDALALFEEGMDAPDAARETPSREQRGSQRQRSAGMSPQAQADEQSAPTSRRSVPRRRQRGGRAANQQAQPPKNEAAQPPEAAPKQRSPDKPGPRRRRRRGGRSGGNAE